MIPVAAIIVLIILVILVVVKVENGGGDAAADENKCQVSEWSPWTECSAACGSGKHSRTRTIIDKKDGNCPALFEEEPCNSQPCTTECVMGDWTPWSDCSTKCGGGTQTRKKPILSDKSTGGLKCPEVNEVRPCNPEACDVDCEVTDWSEWSGCSTACGPGKHTRSRSIKVQPIGKGKPCPALVDSADCDNQPCPVDCVVSPWSDWTPCDLSCGGGSSRRSRSVLVHPTGGGLECPALEQVKPCNNQECNKDCVVSDWSPWSACSASCGGGSSSRVRYIISPASGTGKACPALIDYLDCNKDACPTDCIVSEWSPWSTCSKECGSGIQTRTRTIIKPSTYGTCPSLSESRPCNYQECPVHCKVSDWSNWSECDETCGGGVQIRSREILQFPNSTGTACPVLIDSQDCASAACDVNDFIVSPWSPWSSCGVCGNEQQSRTRTIIKFGAPGRKQPPLRQVRPCSNKQCPTECVVSDWSDWSECTATCGGGVQHRTRFILKYPQNTDKQCPPLVETRECNTQGCAVNCQLGPWSEWSPCSAKCEGGTRTRTRAVTVPAANGGAACGALSEVEPCNTQVCDRDCDVSDWSAWSECTTSCGPGTHSRTRVIRNGPSGKGAACPSLSETVDCAHQACPINCAVSEWSPWTPCSASCGGGISSRSRTVITHPANNGIPCPNLSENQPCNTQSCPVDCIEDEWSAWSNCSATCGGGQQTMTRGIKRAAANGGKPCGDLIRYQPCNSDPCPAPFVISTHYGWGLCTLQNIVSQETPMILSINYQQWIYGGDKTIRLAVSPNLGLSVEKKNYTDEARILVDIESKMDKWEYTPNGPIILVDNNGNHITKDGFSLGVTLLNQDILGGRIILHRGYNSWNRNQTSVFTGIFIK